MYIVIVLVDLVKLGLVRYVLSWDSDAKFGQLFCRLCCCSLVRTSCMKVRPGNSPTTGLTCPQQSHCGEVCLPRCIVYIFPVLNLFREWPHVLFTGMIKPPSPLFYGIILNTFWFIAGLYLVFNIPYWDVFVGQFLCKRRLERF